MISKSFQLRKPVYISMDNIALVILSECITAVYQSSMQKAAVNIQMYLRCKMTFTHDCKLVAVLAIYSGVGVHALRISNQTIIQLSICLLHLARSRPQCSAFYYTVKFGVFPEHPFLEETFWGVGEHPLGCSVSTLGVLI